MPLPLLAIGSTALVGLVSLVGVIFFLLQDHVLKKTLFFILSFAVGAFFGDVFLHMLPEIVEGGDVPSSVWYLILAGLLTSFSLEKFIHWHHCHNVECEEHDRIHPVGIMSLAGDFLHNALDGILIAGSFLLSVPLGIATSIAVALHEIPQEMSDLGILLYSGFTKKRAILLNVLTAFSAVIGAALVFVLEPYVPSLETYLVPFAAGNFLYIAGSDLIPELHRESSAKKSFLQLLGILLGIGFMALLMLME